MTRTDILRLAGAVCWFLVAGMIGTERSLLRRLRSASALNPQTAIRLEPRWPLARLRLGRLERAGAVVLTPSGNRYLDAAGYARYGQARRRRALTVLIVLVPLLFAFGWYMGSRQP